MGLHFPETQHEFSVNGRFNTETVATEEFVVISGAGRIGIGTVAIDAATNMDGQPEI